MKSKSNSRVSKKKRCQQTADVPYPSMTSQEPEPIPYKFRGDAFPPFEELSQSPVYETLKPDSLAAIPAPVVAQIAAILPGAFVPLERVRLAYQLLDMACFVGEIIAKRHPTSCYNAALNLFQVCSMSSKINGSVLSHGFSKLHSKYLPAGWQAMSDADLNKHCVPLEAVLNSIFGRSVPKSKRREKLDEYLGELWPGSYKASDWEVKGVPLVLFQDFWILYPDWRKRKTSASRSNARKGERKKLVPLKGRVKKSNDKRRGSRVEKKVKKNF